MAGFAALDEAERAEDGEATDGFAHGAGADAESASDPRHGAVELGLSFEARVAEEIEIDRTVHDGEAEARVENVSELDAEKFEVEFFGFHELILRNEIGKQKAESRKQKAEERFLDSAGRRVRRSKRGRKNRPAPLGMTVFSIATSIA